VILVRVKRPCCASVVFQHRRWAPPAQSTKRGSRGGLYPDIAHGILAADREWKLTDVPRVPVLPGPDTELSCPRLSLCASPASASGETRGGILCVPPRPPEGVLINGRAMVWALLLGGKTSERTLCDEMVAEQSGVGKTRIGRRLLFVPLRGRRAEYREMSMHPHRSWVARTIVAPILIGTLAVSMGTVGYVLFCPGMYWTAGGRAGQISPSLLTGALVGALFGAAVGLCLAVDRAARDCSARPSTRPCSLAARHRHLRRPPAGDGTARRRFGSRSRSTTGAAWVGP
jgi:hypothetical protein